MCLLNLLNVSAEATKPIIHIAPDEKFIDAAYEIYEKAFHGMNTFLILQNEGQDNIRYLSNAHNYYFIKTDNEYIEKIEQYSRDAKLIVFHGMNYFQALLVNKITKHSKCYAWSVFGGEVYNNNSIIKNESIGIKTFNTFVFSYTKVLKDRFRSAYYSLYRRGLMPNNLIKKSFYKMDFVCILYNEELINYLKLGIIKTDIKHVKFTYYPLDIIIKENAEFVNEANILLGNSASYTNNHLEAFEIIEKLDLRNHNIISTLSYGNKDYANRIIKLGKEKFGERFNPLVEFMPLKEYQKVLQSCGIVIMNHYRQQAVGNVMNAVYLGAKVFLSEKNTLYHYLKRIGCHVYSIDNELIAENKEAFDLLTLEQMTENRAIIITELSLGRVVSELQSKLSPFLYCAPSSFTHKK